jgi:DNA/RNA endonuclease YhcR with UshA esterase domain
MEDQQIFRIALITSIIGLVGMLYFADAIEPREIKINEINRGMIDQDVSLEGVVQNVKKSSTSNTYFLEIMDGTGKITVIIFENAALDFQKQNLSISNLYGRRVRVTGKISEYKGQMEIILNSATSLKIIV